MSVRGRALMMIAPTTGRKTAADTPHVAMPLIRSHRARCAPRTPRAAGEPYSLRSSRSSASPEEQDGGEHDDPDEEPRRVALYVARLDLPQHEARPVR